MTATSLQPARLTEIDRVAEHALARTGVPGMALAITDGAGSTLVRTYGLTDVASGRPVRPDDLFEIGSISKSFGAIAILQLVEEGRLDLHAPLVKALPWFEMPVVGRPISIHDLLTHTAGISVGTDETPESAYQVWALRHRRPGSAPGERFHYSNLGFKALGLVIEAVEGRPYPEVIRTRVLDPLGMAATEPSITNDIHARLATGYAYLHDDRIGYLGRPLAPAIWLETDTADGAIASTAADMAIYVSMLMHRGSGPTGRLLSEASFALLAGPHVQADPTEGYGYGLSTDLVEGRTYLGHSGGMVGFVAGLQIDVGAGLGAIVLKNGVMGMPMTVARRVLRAARGESADSMTIAPASTSDLAGAYLTDPTTTDAVTDVLEIEDGLDGPRLRVEDRAVRLDEIEDGRYLVQDPTFDRFALRFEPTDERPAVVWHGPTRYVRQGATAAPLPSPEPEVAAIAGHYRSFNPWATNFRVIVRGDVPWLCFTNAPDGFEDESPLEQRADGAFVVASDPTHPEDVRFDTVVDGRPLRALLSGGPYFRMR